MTLPRVLIIDDEEPIRHSLASWLEDFDFSVVTAADAESALALLEKQPIDVAVVDIRLPGMSGEEFIRIAHAKFKDMVFLVHTGSPVFKMSRTFLQMPRVVSQVLQKPLHDLTELTRAINSAFNMGPGNAGGE